MKRYTSYKLFTFYSAAALSAHLLTCIPSVHAQDEEAEAPPEKPKWSRSLSVGLTLTEGNTETMTATSKFKADKKTKDNEFSLGANGTYGENEGARNAQIISGFGQMNHLYSERLFAYARLMAIHDAIADVDYRFSLGPGGGYYFIKNEKTTLSTEGGPTYVFEKQGRETNDFLTLRLAEELKHEFNDRVRLWQNLEFLPQVDDFDNFMVNFEIGVETKMTENLNMQAYIQNTYDNDPSRGRKENDVRLVTGVVYSF